MEVNSDHEGCSSRVRPFHCTQVGLTPTIIPNVDNSNAQFLIVGTACALSPLMKTRNDSFHRFFSLLLDGVLLTIIGTYQILMAIFTGLLSSCLQSKIKMPSWNVTYEVETQDHEFGSKQVFKCKTYKVRIKTNSINLALGARQ